LIGVVFFAIRVIDRVDQIRDEQRDLAKAVARIEAHLQAGGPDDAAENQSHLG
jgi:hypothetical protein